MMRRRRARRRWHLRRGRCTRGRRRRLRRGCRARGQSTRAIRRARTRRRARRRARRRRASWTTMPSRARGGRRRHGRARGGLRDSNQGARVHPGFGSAPAPDAPRAGKGGGSMVIRALRGERGLTRHARPRVLLRGCLPEPSRQSHQRAHALRAPRAHTRVPFVRVEGNRRVADRYFAEKKASGMRGSKVFSSTRHAVRHSTPAQPRRGHALAIMTAANAAGTAKAVSAQPGSAGANPFSTVNVSPFLWCAPRRPRIFFPVPPRYELSGHVYSRVAAVGARPRARITRRLARSAALARLVSARARVSAGARAIPPPRTRSRRPASLRLPLPLPGREIFFSPSRAPPSTTSLIFPPDASPTSQEDVESRPRTSRATTSSRGPPTDARSRWNPDPMEREQLPNTFKHSNFASFVRQLNNYGFRKCHSDRFEFGVEGFERGKPELLVTLKRHDAPRSKKSTDKGKRKAAAAVAGRGTRRRREGRPRRRRAKPRARGVRTHNPPSEVGTAQTRSSAPSQGGDAFARGTELHRRRGASPVGEGCNPPSSSSSR